MKSSQHSPSSISEEWRFPQSHTHQLRLLQANSNKAQRPATFLFQLTNNCHSTSLLRFRLLVSSAAMPRVVQYKIALCQLPVTPDKDGNIASARARIEAAAAAGAKLVVLPEIWNCPYAMETIPSYAEDIDGGGSPSVSMLSEVAAATKITIVGGSIPEMASGQLFNTCCVVGPDGEIKAKHGKLAERWTISSCICLELTSLGTSLSGNPIPSLLDKNLLWLTQMLDG